MTNIVIQIWRWLMQPKVWKFVGFASVVVGLLCYALSSSFNYLFGEWNFLKIFLYGVFSFIISLVVLFANIWRHSRSLRFKAHTAYLVLTMTSLYSFFFDKLMNGKPDGYSLISCASFAIMSLSLSRQTQCGFEVDLLYFFLGCLIVQLMKIKQLLFILGAGFSYLLIILRSSVHSMDVGRDNESAGIQDANSIVIEVHSHSPQLPSIDIGSGMVEQLSNYVKVLQQENSYLFEMLLEKLEEYISYDSGFKVSEPDFMIEALPTETIDNLHKTAKLMVSSGFEREFSDVYCNIRRECLVESLSRFWFQKLSIEALQMLTWKELEDEIKRWIKVTKVALRILFRAERQLCDQVFFGLSTTADLSFTDICRESTLQLLNFAEAIAIGSRSPERLFRVLDMFETMRDLIPEFESLFRDQYNGSLQNEATTIWKRLGEAIIGIFMELENLICHDPVNLEAVPGGGIHPITHYVMNYLSATSRSRQTLEQVFEEDYGQSLKEYPKIDDKVQSSSSLSMQMSFIMELLDRNLEAKSKIYKDPALSYIFLMNNSKYMVQKTKDSELGTILGDVVIQKHTTKVQQHHMNYQRNSWSKVLECLKLDNNDSMQPNEVANSMKKKLKSFNMLFGEICRVQPSWFICDKHLKRDIILSIVKLLLPSYAKFIRRFQRVLQLGKNADKYIKYDMEDIATGLDDLFQGSGKSN